jgi:CHAT domain-containing protein
MKLSSIYICFLILYLPVLLIAQSEAALIEAYLQQDSSMQDMEALYDAVMSMEDFTELKGMELLSQQAGMEDLAAAKRIYQQIEQSKDAGQLAKLYHQLGQIHFKQQNYPKALKDFQQALPFLEKSLGGKKHPAISNTLSLIAKSHQKLEQPELALQNYQEALYRLSVDNEPANRLDLPGTKHYIDPGGAFQILGEKVDVHQALYQAQSNVSHLKNALRALSKQIELIAKVKQKYQAESYKLLLGEAAVSVYGQAIQTALKLYEATRENHYQEKAFEFAEAGKANLLIEALQKVMTRQSGAVPVELLQREKEAKTLVANLRLNVQENPTKFRDQLLTAETNLAEVQEAIAPHLSAWQELDIPMASINALQAILKPTDSFISYFSTEAMIYRFSVRQKSLEVDSIIISSELYEQINQFKTELSTNHFEIAPQAAFHNYTQTAYLLFRQLLGLQEIKGLDKLIISPDHSLWQIPFEALLTTQTETSNISYSLSNLPYLIRQAAVSYANSASLYLHHHNSKHTASRLRTIATYAPVFSETTHSLSRASCEAEQLAGLQYNRWEAEQIADIMSGDVFVAQQANKANFMEAAQNYKMLHLATHACLDDEDPMGNKIFFSDDALDVADLYDLDIQAEMIVLSACETGLGTVHRGEGVMSLARGFSQANCPSVIMSLWNIADDASAELMVPFYQALKSGYDKSQALRQAKLEFLEHQDKIKEHPYYWAGFVHIGLESAVQNNENRKWIWFGILGILAFFVIFGLKKK